MEGHSGHTNMMKVLNVQWFSIFCVCFPLSIYCALSIFFFFFLQTNDSQLVISRGFWGVQIFIPNHAKKETKKHVQWIHDEWNSDIFIIYNYVWILHHSFFVAKKWSPKEKLWLYWEEHKTSIGVKVEKAGKENPNITTCGLDVQSLLSFDRNCIIIITILTAVLSFVSPLNKKL